jgi:hypothetical protein
MINEYPPSLTDEELEALPDPIAVTVRKTFVQGSVYRHIVHCPFCGEEHIHGGGSVKYAPYFGDCVSHCQDITVQDCYELTEWKEELERMSA